MKEASHQRTEEEIEFVFKNSGLDYPQVPAPALASKVSLGPPPTTFSPTSVNRGHHYTNREK